MTVSPSQSPEQANEHLNPVAARMIMAALPERIQQAITAYSEETEYPVEMILEMAISGFLDSESLTFEDCKAEYSDA